MLSISRMIAMRFFWSNSLSYWPSS